jgi:hypothetical protein
MANQTLSPHQAKVIAMAEVAYNRVSGINAEVDPHKRYNRNDSGDPYGEVIEWVHETGAWLFGPYSE